MLSVQVPGRAGMERLGAPGGLRPGMERRGAPGGPRPGLGAPGGPRHRHDHRLHSTLEWENKQRLQAMVSRRIQEMVEEESRARSVAAAERLGLPPSIRLPDGETPDRHLQIRAPYQQEELTRNSVQPPPNKCVSDVPDWAVRGGATTTASAAAAAAAGGKKDGLLQKATRWWVRMGARPSATECAVPSPAVCPPPAVMVPRRAPPPDA